MNSSVKSRPDLGPLLAASSIAVIGASNDPYRIGGIPLVHLSKHELNTYNDYRGRVYPVNPKYKEIFGLPTYPDIESVPEAVELAIIAVSAEQVMQQLERCHARGVKAAMVFAAGYAETNEEKGFARQRELVAFAERTGMLIAGPNCMGNANMVTGAHSTFAASGLFVPRPGVLPHVGRIGLVTQSGNMCAIVFMFAQRIGVGFNFVINTGNEAVVEFSQYLDYVLEDHETDAAVGYIEQLRDGPAFLNVAQRFRERGKLLAVIKAGLTEKGAEAARSHTAALAGNYAAFAAACKQSGVLIADDLPHLALIAYLTRFGRQGGKRVAVVTMSGAAGALLSDKFVGHGAELPTLPAEAQAKLRALIPDYGMVSNPVDVTGNIQNAVTGGYSTYYKTVKALVDCDEIDTIVLWMPGYYLDGVTKDLIQLATETGKLIVAIDPSDMVNPAALEAGGIPVFNDMMRAVKAISSYSHWCDDQKALKAAGKSSALKASTASGTAVSMPKEAVTILSGIAATLPCSLDEAAGKNLLASFGVPVVGEKVVGNADDAASAARVIGYPVAIKVLSEDIQHKTEAGGVMLGLASDEAVRAAFAAVTDNARRYKPSAKIAGAVVQAMTHDAKTGANELLVGVTRDPVFGLMMTVGLGGVWTELFKDVSHRLLPVGEDAALEMLKSLKGFALLDGYRGAPKADLDAACKAIAGISRAASTIGDAVLELEVNPLVVLPQGRGAKVVDVLLTVDPGKVDL